jgi:hypothetical protein
MIEIRQEDQIDDRVEGRLQKGQTGTITGKTRVDRRGSGG